MGWGKIRRFLMDQVRLRISYESLPPRALGPAAANPHNTTSLASRVKQMSTVTGFKETSGALLGSMFRVAAAKVVSFEKHLPSVKNEIEADQASQRARKLAVEFDVELRAVDPVMLETFRGLAKEDKYRKLEAWSEFELEEIEAIADTGLQFLSLVVDKQMDFKSASNIVSVAQDILAHGIDVAPQWSANIMDSSYKQDARRRLRKLDV